MKLNYFFISCLSAAMLFCASCSSDSDGDDNNGGGNGGGSNVEAMTAAEAKQSLQTTADELLAKVNANEFDDVKQIFDVCKDWEFDDDNIVSQWFESAKSACLISSKKDFEKYLWQASNFVGEFTLSSNNVWKQTAKGGDKLVFKFNDAKNNPCELTIVASKDGATIHHNVFDDKDWNWNYENGYYEEYETTTQENRFILPKQTKVTLTQNGKTKVNVVVNANVSTGQEVDLSKDAVDVTTEAVINDYQVVVSKASYKQGKAAEAKATISKGKETLITVNGNANGNVTKDGDGSTVGKVNIQVDVLGKAKVVATIDDVDLLNENLDKASECYTDKNGMEKYLANANKLLNANLYLENSKNSSAKLLFSPVADGNWNGTSYWDYETVMKFADGSEYSVESYFNEKSFKSVIDKINNIIDDFCNMFEIDEDEDVDYPTNKEM